MVTESSCRILLPSVLLLITMVCLDMVSTCHLHEHRATIQAEGYRPYLITYNVCVDNTTIYSQPPTRNLPNRHIFSRECCGCRVSSIFERELLLETIYPRETHTFYFNEIRGCQCISCDLDQNPHLLPLIELSHKKK